MIEIKLTPQQFNQLYELLVIGMKAGNVTNMKVGLPLVELLEAAAAYSQSKPE
jgi:hypothetical protein